MVKEDTVQSVAEEHFSGKFHTIECGEVSLDRGSDAWKADILCKSNRKIIQLAVECKGDNETQIRSGISQALGYYLVYDRKSALVADFGNKTRSMLKSLPLSGYDVKKIKNEVTIDKFTDFTNFEMAEITENGSMGMERTKVLQENMRLRHEITALKDFIDNNTDSGAGSLENDNGQLRRENDKLKKENMELKEQITDVAIEVQRLKGLESRIILSAIDDEYIDTPSLK